MHTRSCHAGMVVMNKNLTKIYKCKEMRKNIKEVVKECEACILNKRENVKVERLSVKSSKLFGTIAIDIFGPFDLEKYENDNLYTKGYYLCITDIYSRFLEVYLLFCITERKIMKKVDK